MPERDGRGDIFGDTSCPLATHGVIKINNRTDPPKQQNANLELMQKDTEQTAKKPSVDNPDVSHSRALLRCCFIFLNSCVSGVSRKAC